MDHALCLAGYSHCKRVQVKQTQDNPAARNLRLPAIKWCTRVSQSGLVGLRYVIARTEVATRRTLSRSLRGIMVSVCLLEDGCLRKCFDM